MAFLYVAIPALNEAENIERVLADLAIAQARLRSRITMKVVLVDDGSTDGTADRARGATAGLDLTILRHETPQGPGRAFATAFETLATRLDEHDFVLTLESDNTSRLELVDTMLRRASEGYDAVFASPYAYGGGIVHTNAFRTGLSHIANTFVKECLGIHGLLTVSSFYRLHRGSAIRTLQEHFGPRIIERAGFECMVELVLKMIYLGMSISEVPMLLDTSRRQGRSKMRVGRVALGYLTLFFLKRDWQLRARRTLAEGEGSRGPSPRARDRTLPEDGRALDQSF